MHTALTELRDSTTGSEIRSDRFPKAGKVAALCAQQGVILSPLRLLVSTYAQTP